MSSDFSSSFHQFKLKVSKANGHSVYVFDDFRLECDKLMLYRAGMPVSLPPRAIETLAVLVKHRGEIISKDAIIEAVWRDSVVEESNLTQYLYLIRKTLSVRPGGKPYIETLRKRGYRFDCDTYEVSDGRPTDEEEPDQLATGASRAIAAGPQIHTEAEREVQPAGTGGSSLRRYLFLLVIPVVLVAAFLGVFGWYSLTGIDRSSARVELNLTRLTNGIEVQDTAISPDGKYFVYHELDGPRSRIWIQQTGQSNRLEIVPWGERWHGSKTFSPDGNYVYFLEFDEKTGNNLVRVPSVGGQATRVLSGIWSSISFSPDGREYAFYRHLKRESRSQIVVRTTEATGTERVIHSWTDELRGSYVAWSPDGGRIAFTSRTKDDEQGHCSIEQVDLSSGRVSRLWNETLDTCYAIAWHPDGKGLYAIATKIGDGYSTRRDQLYFLTFADGHMSRLTLDGSRLQPNSLSVTRNGSVLIVPFNRSSQIWAMDSNGDVRTAVQLSSGLNDGRAGIAPLADGRVAYIARSGENLSVWAMNTDGSEQKQLTTSPEYMEELRASGDGKYLFFSAPSLQGNANDLFRINSDGTGQVQVTFGSHVIDSGLSHDGKWLAFGDQKKARNETFVELWKMSVEGGGPKLLLMKDCSRPHFSRDDRFLSCIGRKERIYIVSADDGSVLSSFPAPPRSTLNFGSRWAPDGKSVVYIATERDVSNLWLQPIDGSEPKRLTDFTAGSIYHFAYSRDYKTLYIARGTQIRDAILISDSAK